MRIVEAKIEPQRVYQKERFMIKVKVDKIEFKIIYTIWRWRVWKN